MPRVVRDELRPFWTTTDGETVKLYHGDVLDVLRRMPEKSVHMIVTSPPYWGLRDYETGQWEGGDTKCGHRVREDACVESSTLDGGKETTGHQREGFKNLCPRCGARRIDRQLGNEQLHDCLGWARGENCAERDWQNGCYICRIVLVCRELRRVLRDDGVMWWNVGDSYSSAPPGNTKPRSERGNGRGVFQPNSWGDKQEDYFREVDVLMDRTKLSGLKSGNLVGIPFRTALALQADGWTLRQDIIWSKKSAMPESVKTRCTKSHEYVFLLAKGMRYFFDAEAIKEAAVESSLGRQRRGVSDSHKHVDGAPGQPPHRGAVAKPRDYDSERVISTSANKRSVWRVSSQGYPGAHFACFPPTLIKPMILAGTSERGCCGRCGAPWSRVADGWQPTCGCFGEIMKRRVSQIKTEIVRNTSDKNTWRLVNGMHSTKSTLATFNSAGKVEVEVEVEVEEYVSNLPLQEHPVAPCTVLDPFIGSGTSCCVALDHGRRSIGIDLNETYLTENAIPRISGEILKVANRRHLVQLTKPKSIVLGSCLLK